MNFFSALKIVFTTLPAIVRLVEELAGWLQKNFGDNPAKAIEEHAAAISKLKEAKTREEKLAAAASLSKLIRRL